ncbi:unnamed protein product [Prunus armeniaca]|uniref:E2F/DP family winged-helix DNA-binding domain-containing protein n=1 Tax=Prunus armeniaca TaxID=36596 RepID=A0A6J5VCS5_PRUAR|nr:unnamed protein product [Prunus armeniaca]
MASLFLYQPKNALQELREEGLRENCINFVANDDTKVSDDEDDEERCGSQLNDKSNPIVNPQPPADQKTDNRREKSLALLTQNFMKLFICSTKEMISLDDVTKLLLGDAQSASAMRTKTHTADTRKPAFKWLGLRGKEEDLVPNESRKRAFGTDITNVISKRGKMESSIGVELDA